MAGRAEKVLLGYGTWQENPCDCDVAEGCVVDDGDPATYRYECWCAETWRVAVDDPEVVAALALVDARDALAARR